MGGDSDMACCRTWHCPVHRSRCLLDDEFRAAAVSHEVTSSSQLMKLLPLRLCLRLCGS